MTVEIAQTNTAVVSERSEVSEISEVSEGKISDTTVSEVLEEKISKLSGAEYRYYSETPTPAFMFGR